LGPWALSGQLGLGFGGGGGWLAHPGRRLSSLVVALGLPFGGGVGAPPRKHISTCLEPSSPPGAPPSSPPLSLPLAWPPKGCLGARRHHRCIPSCCRVSGFGPKPSTSAISAGSEIPKVIMITVHVRVCEVLHLWCRSCCIEFFDDSEVGYVSFIINACTGA
jgi:hypothetical protein